MVFCFVYCIVVVYFVFVMFVVVYVVWLCFFDGWCG